MAVAAMRKMPSAAAATSMPSGSAMRVAMARRAASISSRISPPRNRSAPSRPSSRLASVTVGSVPPSPWQAVLEAGDRAAAGADLKYVHHRDLDRQRLLVAADEG